MNLIKVNEQLHKQVNNISKCKCNSNNNAHKRSKSKLNQNVTYELKGLIDNK
jgi:hypothetical protein